MGLAIDPSTPAVTVQSVGTTQACTSASFTPPAGSLLLVLWSGNSTGDPAQPTITDTVGLSWTTHDWQSHIEAPNADGQAAQFSATVGSSTSMTVTVNNQSASGTRHAEMQVLVLTGQLTSGAIGAHGKSGSVSAGSIAQGYTATGDGSWGFVGACDWDALGTPSAGTGCSLANTGDAGTIAGQISYGQVRRTVPDGVNGATTTVNMTIAGTSTNLSWTYIEILAEPSPGGMGALHPFLARRFIMIDQWRRNTAPSAAEAIDYTVDQTDDTGLTDNVEKTESDEHTDDVGLTDSVEKTQAIEQSDQVGLTDNIEKIESHEHTDQTGITDTITASSTFDRGFTDQTGLTDSATEELVKAVSQTDNVGLTDSAATAVTFSPTQTDNIGLTDTTTRASTHDRTFTDQTGLTDSSVLELAKAVTVSDSTGLTDSVTSVSSYARSVTDSIGLTDAITEGATHERTFNEQIGLTDSQLSGLVREVTSTDTIGLTDSTSSTSSYVRNITDSTGLTDIAIVEGIEPPPPIIDTDWRNVQDTITWINSPNVVGSGAIPEVTWTNTVNVNWKSDE